MVAIATWNILQLTKRKVSAALKCVYSRCVIHTALFVLRGGENSLCKGGFVYTTSRICQSTVNLFAWPMNPMRNSIRWLSRHASKRSHRLIWLFSSLTDPRCAVYNVTCCLFFKLSHSERGVILRRTSRHRIWKAAEISNFRIFKFYFFFYGWITSS